MEKLSVARIIDKINKEETFEATANDGSFSIKINRYVPYVCTAIHAGHHLRDELVEKCLHSEYDRWYEEDPYTDDFIASMPITLVGNDSRFEYDLNRDPENCVYKEAWGKKVWKRALTKQEVKTSLKKHQNYYKVTHALIKQLEKKFDACIVYDMHTYNYKRWDREVPVFNIGAEKINKEKFGKYVEHFNEELNKIQFREIESYSGINDTFFGRGYNLQFITENFDKTLVLATEVKKIFCDELTGDVYPTEIKYLTRQLKKAILNNATLFIREKANVGVRTRSRLLDREIDSDLFAIDKQLHTLLNKFELLNAINPINLDKEEKIFYKNKGLVNPSFHYKPIPIDPYKIKKELYSIDLQKIEDVSIQKMYEGVIDSFADKTDLLATIGKERFLYNSFRYFGRPSENDLRNAKYLLSLPPIPSDKTVNLQVGVKEAKEAFQRSFKDYGFKGSKIGVTSDMASDVMVINSEKKVLIKRNSKFSIKELNYLVHHEIGVHMVTTMNSIDQPLKVFNLGLPVNTKTQEGLAVLAEYLSGNITLRRLRTLALRVIAIDMMCLGADFVEVYNTILNDYKEDKRETFNLVARVFRGGGFTKDYLYLAGFTEIYHKWKSGYDLEPLLIGKTSTKYYNTIVEMIDREYLNQPKYITSCFQTPNLKGNHSIYEYIIDGLVYDTKL